MIFWHAKWNCSKNEIASYPKLKIRGLEGNLAVEVIGVRATDMGSDLASEYSDTASDNEEYGVIAVKLP